MPPARVERLIDGCLMAPFPGLDPPAWLLHRIERGLGAVCLFGTNIANPDQLHRLVASLRSARADLVVALDEEGGDVTRLHSTTGSPHAGHATLGAVDDPDLTRAVAGEIGAELAAAGIDLDLAPCLDVNSDPQNPVIGVRSFGSTPELAARHGVAFVRGLHDAGVRACAKHFPGHGDTAVDSHLDLPTIDVGAEVLQERELVPFRAAVGAGVDAVMPSHLLVPAVDDRPASVSRRFLVDVLRTDLGFTGAVVTDALDMGGICRDGGMPAAAVRAIAAGADLCCLGASAGADDIATVAGAISAALADGALGEERLTDASGRAAALTAPPASHPRVLDRRASQEAARRAVRVEGQPSGALRSPLVVTCRPPSGIAVGPVPWGPAADVLALDPTATALDAGPDTSAASVLSTAGERPLVIVVRDAHRHHWQDALVDALAHQRPDLVVVEMGWPAPLSGSRAVSTRVLTFGASRPNAAAAAAVLVGEVAPWH
jgi:beta-N-acetylhexosaminidase